LEAPSVQRTMDRLDLTHGLTQLLHRRAVQI
jgi:hypothetical protein